MFDCLYVCVVVWSLDCVSDSLFDRCVVVFVCLFVWCVACLVDCVGVQCTLVCLCAQLFVSVIARLCDCLCGCVCVHVIFV